MVGWWDGAEMRRLEGSAKTARTIMFIKSRVP